jgi:hypothetical protein
MPVLPCAGGNARMDSAASCRLQKGQLEAAITSTGGTPVLRSMAVPAMMVHNTGGPRVTSGADVAAAAVEAREFPALRPE